MRASAILAPLLLALSLSSPAGAADTDDDTQDTRETAAVSHDAAVNLHPQHGRIALPGGLGTMTLPVDLEYLSPQDTNALLQHIKHFQGQFRSLGSVVPAKPVPGSKESWIALITFRSDGHVRDEDAKTALDPAALMKRLRGENDAHNAELKKHGLPWMGIDIDDWTDPPHYDAASHTLRWGLEVHEHARETHISNYNIRALGRRGLVDVSIITPIEQLPAIQDAAQEIAQALAFNGNERYRDFRPSEKKAPYTLADIVADDLHPHKNASQPAKAGQSDSNYLLSFMVLAGIIFFFRLKAKKKV